MKFCSVDSTGITTFPISFYPPSFTLPIQMDSLTLQLSWLQYEIGALLIFNNDESGRIAHAKMSSSWSSPFLCFSEVNLVA